MIASTLKKAIGVKQELDDVNKLMKSLVASKGDDDTDSGSLYIAVDGRSILITDVDTIASMYEVVDKLREKLQLQFDSL